MRGGVLFVSMTDRPGTIITDPADERQYVTMAWMMQETGLAFRTLRDALAEIGIEPDFMLNNIRYYSVKRTWPKLYCHLVNSGLLEMEIHMPAESVSIKRAGTDLRT